MITIEIEAKVLALLARDKEFGLSVMPYLAEGLFSLPQHRTFFRFIDQFYKDYGVPPSLESLTHAVKTTTAITDSDQLRALGELVFQVYNSGLAADSQYIKDQVSDFVKHAAFRRFLGEAGMALEEGKVEEIVKKFEIARIAGTTTDKKLGELVEGFEARVLQREMCEKQQRVPTGFANIDAILRGGLGEKELGVILAPTNVGKSQMLCNLAANAIKNKKRCLYITLELSELEVFSRVEANLTGIPIDGLVIRSQYLRQIKEELFTKYSGLFYVAEYPTKMVSVDIVNALVKRFMMQHGKLDLLCIDYADLFKMSKNVELRHELEEAYGKLRGVASENEVALWTATQANRAAYKEDRVEESHVSEAIGKVQVADVVLTLNQNEEEQAKGRMRVYVAKNRRGRKWHTVVFQTAFERASITELDSDVATELQGLSAAAVDNAIARSHGAVKDKPPEIPVVHESSDSAKSIQAGRDLKKSFMPNS